MAKTTDFGTAIHEAPERVVLVLWGEMDLSVLAEFERALDQAHAPHPAEIRLDLERLTFIDSSGVRALLKATQAAAEHGTALVLSPHLAPGVRRVLSISGVADMLAFAPE